MIKKFRFVEESIRKTLLHVKEKLIEMFGLVMVMTERICLGINHFKNLLTLFAAHSALSYHFLCEMETVDSILFCSNFRKFIRLITLHAIQDKWYPEGKNFKSINN
jgi:hypothetical protein